MLIGDDQEEIQKLKNNLAREFKIKDLGDVKYLLVIEVARFQKGIFI